jgi:hypothetical protein
MCVCLITELSDYSHAGFTEFTTASDCSQTSRTDKTNTLAPHIDDDALIECSAESSVRLFPIFIDVIPLRFFLLFYSISVVLAATNRQSVFISGFMDSQQSGILGS